MPNQSLKTGKLTPAIDPESAESTQSNEFTTVDRDTVLQSIASIHDMLPFLVDLTKEERKALPRLGNSSYSFARKALEVAQHNQDFLPRSLDVEQMQQTLQRWEYMGTMLLAINQLQDLMDDTYVALGSSLFSDALTVYHAAKAANHTGTLEQAVVDMGQRFARKTSQPKVVKDAAEATTKAD